MDTRHSSRRVGNSPTYDLGSERRLSKGHHRVAYGAAAFSYTPPGQRLRCLNRPLGETQAPTASLTLHTGKWLGCRGTGQPRVDRPSVIRSDMAHNSLEVRESYEWGEHTLAAATPNVDSEANQ